MQQQVLCFEGWWPPNATSDTNEELDTGNHTYQLGMLLEWWDVLLDGNNRSADSDFAPPLRLSAVMSDERFPGLPSGQLLVQQQRGTVTVPLATIPQHSP